jgi:membrane protein
VQRRRGDISDRDRRPLPEEAPQPQPEHEEPKLEDPTPSSLSARDYLAILKRAVKKTSKDYLTNIAAALAYYGFLAIPATLLVVLGVFGLLAGPGTVSTIMDKVGTVMPAEAESLLRSALTNVTESHGTGIALIGVGSVLALWTLTGAMQNLMWALNIAYDREETRGFARRRLASLMMVLLVFIGFALSFGLLVLGPHLAGWVGDAVGQRSLVEWIWWVAQWPVLIGGLLFAFAGILYLGPNVDHPRWRFMSFGAIVAVVVWLAASGAFAFYTSRFGSYNKTWGSLAAVVVMLIWLWLSSLALLFGAEVNAEAERSRELRRGEPAEMELQAPRKA